MQEDQAWLARFGGSKLTKGELDRGALIIGVIEGNLDLG